MFDLHKRVLPPLGQRIIKTAAAVFICLIIYMLRGYQGMVGQSVVAAILCMQPYAHDTKTFAADRVVGTVLGGVWALAFLLLMRQAPGLAEYQIVVYLLMAVFVILSIYSTVVIKKSDLAALVAICLMGTVATYPDVEAPVQQTVTSVVDTAIGTVVAIAVNGFHVPRRKHPEHLYFVRTMDIVPNRFRQIPSSVHIALDKLYEDGAKICLVSQWAPAFIISQMGLLNVNAPMIIMDGAALYDIRENRYLDVIPIPREDADRLRSILGAFGVGVNLYAVNERTMAIYHDGVFNMEEKREQEAMKRSPFRNYADGLPHEEDWIAFMRVIDTTKHIEELAYQLKSVLPTNMFRMAVRPDDRYQGTSGLYFYHPDATVEKMKLRAKAAVEAEYDQDLKPIDMLPITTKYLPEHDALMLLGRLKNKYEPVSLIPSLKKQRR